MPTCRLCDQKFPNWLEINGKLRNLKNRKYCIQCSGWNQHNTRSLESKLEKTRKCCECGTTEEKAFYGHKRRICGSCHNQYCLKTGQEKRLKIIAHLGGKCSECSFDKYSCSLDVHHLDPTKKDPKFGGIRSWKWERIVKELEGCRLLCKNCHAAIHNGLLAASGL